MLHHRNKGFLTLIDAISGSHVVVAGNEEAFRSLAKKFVPQKLANQLASLMTQATEKYEPEDYYDNKDQGYDDGDYQNNQYGNVPEDQIVNEDAYVQEPVKKAVIKKPKTVQVNLDELVEKVKDRILQDFQVANKKPRFKPARGPNQKRLQTQEENENGNENGNGNGNGNSNGKHTQNKNSRNQGRLMSVNRPSQSKNKIRKPVGEIIEKHDLFDKVKLNKGKGQKDSYEDYVIPKKEYDAYEPEDRNDKKEFVKREYSKETENVNAKREEQTRFSKKNQPDFTERTRSTRKEHDNNNNFGNRQRTPSYDDYNQNSRSKSTAKTSKIDYVDDDYHTQASTTEHEPKAMTEFIGNDSNEDDQSRVVTRSKETTYAGYVNTKKKVKKIVTNMPTRERFKISTPNYYEKLPRIAEKYNFDEPLPERDREEENMKSISNQNAAINGKIRV